MTVWTDLLGTSFGVHQVRAGDLETRVLTAGTGPPVLFLHGISGHLEAFSRTVPGHAEHFAVHALDMLGHGLTTKPDDPYTIDRYAQHIIDYLDAEGIERAHLVGISLGGWVAAWLGAHSPERVDRLTLIVPGGLRADEATMTRIRESTLAGVRNSDREWTRKRLNQLMATSDTVTDELVEIRYLLYHRPEFAAHVEDVLALEDPEIRPRYLLSEEHLGRIEAETLVVWPRRDPYAGVADGERFRDLIPVSKLVVFNDCGHWPPFERPGPFLSVNIPFLQNGLKAVTVDEI